MYFQKRLRFAVSELGRARALWAYGLPVRLTEEVTLAGRYSPAQFAEVLASVKCLARGRTITVFADCRRKRPARDEFVKCSLTSRNAGTTRL